MYEYSRIIKISQYISKMRRVRNYSQKKLAKMLGLPTKSLISKIEQGVLPLPDKHILAVVQALRIDIDDLASVMAMTEQARVRDLYFKQLREQEQKWWDKVTKGIYEEEKEKI